VLVYTVEGSEGRPGGEDCDAGEEISGSSAWTDVGAGRQWQAADGAGAATGWNQSCTL